MNTITQSFITPKGVITTTVSVGEIPIIPADVDTDWLMDAANGIAASAINFLSSGCPRVRIILPRGKNFSASVDILKEEISRLDRDIFLEYTEQDCILTISKKVEKV